MSVMENCQAVDCNLGAKSSGFCSSHYMRIWRHGSPYKGNRPYAKGSERERLMTFVNLDLNSGCWNWNGAKDKKGYGTYHKDKKPTPAHRFSYELFNNKSIPQGLYIDHICRNPSCVNPSHLDPVTPKENQYRSPITLATINKNKEVCPKGHIYDADNTYIRPNNKGRKCRKCNAERWHK